MQLLGKLGRLYQIRKNGPNTIGMGRKVSERMVVGRDIITLKSYTQRTFSIYLRKCLVVCDTLSVRELGPRRNICTRGTKSFRSST